MTEVLNTLKVSILRSCRLFFLIFIIIFSNYEFSRCQTKDEPSLNQTIEWIKSKLILYTYGEVTREVEFNEEKKVLKIIDHNFDVAYAKITYTVEIPLAKLNPSGVGIDKGTDDWVVFHLILSTYGDKSIKGNGCCPPDGEKNFTMNRVQIFLNRSALDDNIDERLKKAFIHAIELCSGKKSKEYF